MTPGESLATDELTSLSSQHCGDSDVAALMLEDPPTCASERKSSRKSSTSKAKSSKCKHETSSESEEEEDAPCEVCGETGDDDKAILCEICDGAFHMYCLTPPLTSIPEGDWFCDTCVPQDKEVKNEEAEEENVENEVLTMSKEVHSSTNVNAAEESKEEERHALKEIN